MPIRSIHNTMFRRLFRPKKVRTIMLGRWDTHKPARKAELANHDHCGGPQCSKTVLTKYFDTSGGYDNSMDISICALQSMHAYPGRNAKV